MNKDLWMVRAGEGAYLVDKFIEEGIVAIGWDVDDLSNVDKLSQVKERYKKIYPEDKPGKANLNAGQIYRFRKEIEKGSKVVTYDPSERVYHIGEITSDYQYNPKADYNHVRKVNWKKKVNRDTLSTTAKNSLGAISTIFKIPEDVAQELFSDKKSKSEKEVDEIGEEDTQLDLIKEDIEERAHEFIKDKIQRLDWEDMQELIAGLLRGMGYQTMVSKKGPDRGKDIIASPDGLGLEDPKIKVEVKHRSGSMGSADIRSLLGGLRQGEKALFVSTGGFTKDAKYEAERALNPLTLIDLDLLVGLIIQHYDKFDSEARSLLPLKKIYWPL